MDIETHGSEVAVIFDHKALESSLKQVPASLVAPVKPDGVGQSQPLDGPGEVRIAGLNQKVIVIAH